MSQAESVAFFENLGLSTAIIQTLVDNKIHAGNFAKLIDSDITQLFPLLGERVDVREAVAKRRDRSQVHLLSFWPVFAKTVFGLTVAVKCHAGTKVLELKTAISDASGIQLDDQYLVFGGKQLIDERNLQHYNVQPESIIHLHTARYLFKAMLGLSDEISQKLIANKVNSGNFLKLTDADLQEFFPFLGERIDIKIAFENVERSTVSDRKLKRQADILGVSAASAKRAKIGFQIQEGRTLREYGVVDESTVDLVLRLKGC